MSDNFNEYNNDMIDNSNSGAQQRPHYDNYYADTVIQSEESAAPQTDSSGSYAYVSENAPKPKKRKNHAFLKAVAFVLCLGIVGVGSVQGYKIYRDNKDGSELSEPEKEEKTSSASKDVELNYSEDAEAEDTPSIITLAAREDSKPIPDIVDSIMPSIVGVSSNFEITQNYSFFGWESGPQTKQMTGTGTGFIISEDGYIVTNAHVVFDSEYNSGPALEVSVMFSDESEHDAKIVAYDVETDIAVLKVDETGLTPATLGNSDELRVGELVIAVGNPLGFELFGSVTSGIVSALNRDISINEKSMSLIQTDAPINNGNSGGPLLNSCGQVIGINSAKMSSSYGSASVEGLGFAIPITDAKKIIDDLINYKHVKGRPQIGISTKDVTESISRYYNIPMGIWITEITDGSAADEAGLEQGDIIIDIEGEAVKTAEELNAIKNQYKAGDTINLTVYRRGEDIKVEVTLQDADEQQEKETEDSAEKKEKRQPATAAPRQSDPYEDFDEFGFGQFPF
ncbi:MAG: PDZ domain-containing protein [Ruminococcus sp.]|nr:PDZ domain-containing protein [Ruminococcus sp.]